MEKRPIRSGKDGEWCRATGQRGSRLQDVYRGRVLTQICFLQAFEESLRQCKNFFGAGDIRQIKALSCLGRLHSDTGWKESKPESAMLFLESAYEKSKVWLGER